MHLSQSSQFINSKIVHDTLNQSPAKQQYSFPIQPRFKSTSQKIDVPFYEIPSTIEKRSAALGYGEKTDFTKQDFNKPGPGFYESKSTFEINRRKNKGSSFSVGREKLKFGKIIPNSQNPGPGQYAPQPLEKNIYYSFGSRTPNHRLMTTTRFNPGPGQYEIKGIDPTGNYIVSKIPGQCSPVFSPSQSDRFKMEFPNILKNPGSGQYELESIRSTGKYTNSKLKNALGGKFGTGERFYIPKQKLSVPGPGFYRQLSEFGDVEYPEIPSKKGTSQVNFRQTTGSGFSKTQNKLSDLQKNEGKQNLNIEPPKQQQIEKNKEEKSKEIKQQEQPEKENKKDQINQQQQQTDKSKK